jgi:uncharacterized protein YqgC (DUF456 family)
MNLLFKSSYFNTINPSAMKLASNDPAKSRLNALSLLVSTGNQSLATNEKNTSFIEENLGHIIYFIIDIIKDIFVVMRASASLYPKRWTFMAGLLGAILCVTLAFILEDPIEKVLNIEDVEAKDIPKKGPLAYGTNLLVFGSIDIVLDAIVTFATSRWALPKTYNYFYPTEQTGDPSQSNTSEQRQKPNKCQEMFQHLALHIIIMFANISLSTTAAWAAN